MTELTPEEKRRIYEEEKVRIESQEKIKRKISRKTKPATWGCLILIILIVIVFITICNETQRESGSSAPAPKKEEVVLKAGVRFTGTQFIIQNNNDFVWTNIRFKVNRGYYYNAKKINPSIEYTIGAAQFAKSDGTRFNPFTMKPQTFFIAADTPRGRAYYTASWE